MLKFALTARDGLARTGILQTAHGPIETPHFMTVATLGAPKALSPQQVLDHGAQILLMNAFHLAWRPGVEIVRQMGGLHRFSGWKGAILTDSGGFQIFSLPGLRKVTDEGATFASTVDGSVRLFSPEAVVELSCALGPDIAMVLDECPPYPCSPATLTGAIDRSILWAQRAHRRAGELAPENTNFFGIIQGGTDERQRQRSLEATAAMPFAGFALGGFCVGEPIEDTHRGIVFCAPRMPADKPRYLMGMGTPADILLGASQGLDLFDCTIPTRNGRNGLALTSRGKLKLKNARYAQDSSPLDPACGCYTCAHFSRGFLRHLLLAREMNAAILTSLHNLAFYFNLMRNIREAIKAQRLAAFSAEFLEGWNSNGVEQISG